MTAELFIYNGIAKKINKFNEMTSVKSYADLKPFEPFNVENPRLIVDYSEGLADANYACVDGIYYFVVAPAYLVGERLVFELAKDVLMSNINELLSMKVIMQRNSSMFNSYISDDRQIGQVNNTIFSIGMGGWSYGNGITVFASVGGKEIGSI